MKAASVATVLALTCLLFASPSAHAQGVGASGNIIGTITDPSGAVVPKVAVVARQVDKGIQHATVTDASGEYHFLGLPPTIYSVAAATPGFQKQTQTGVVVNIGAMTTIDFHLTLSAAASTVEVTAEPPVVETERGSQADTITQDYISDLPIDRRDYLSFTLLEPGVSNSTRVADDQDFRVVQTPQSGLSFYGSNGRGNSVTVDGGEANDDSGGVRLTVSQDGVQEFQINRSNYSADLGGASGASINIVTKSGSNELHGSLFGFFRNDALDARDPFAFSSALAPNPTFSNFNTTSSGAPIKNSLSRYQYGGSVGGPIQKERTFFFASFEGLLNNSENSVPLLTSSSIFAGPSVTGGVFSPSDPRAAQQAIVSALAAQPVTHIVPCLNNPNGTITSLPAPLCAGALQNALTVSPFTGLPGTGQMGINQFLVQQFENNSGLFPFHTREYLGSVRLDHNFDDHNQFTASYRFGHDLEENPNVQSLTGFSAGNLAHNYDSNLQAAWYHEFSPSMQNEFHTQFNYDGEKFVPNSPAEVGLQIAGFANALGTNIFLPEGDILRRYEIADNMTVIRGHHTMKFGGSELLRGGQINSHTYFPGRFVFGPLNGGILSDCLAAPALACGLSGALASASLSSLQTTSLGLPQFYEQGFGKLSGAFNYKYSHTRPLTAVYWEDSWSVASNLTLNFGLRYELDTQYAPLSSDRDNFGPRISIAWDPFKDHKTVIRAGYGIFYAQTYDQVPGVDYSLGILNANGSAVENRRPCAGLGCQVANATGICGFAGLTPGTGNPCNRPVSIYVDPLVTDPLFPAPAQSSAFVFQSLFAYPVSPAQAPAGTVNPNKISCTIPAPGEPSCITAADLSTIGSGIRVANSGLLSPLQVAFVNSPNYQNPISQQAELSVEREVAPGFSVSLSYIYVHTQRLPVAIDTNLLPAPFEAVTLANGKTVSYRDWSTSAAADPLSVIRGPAFMPPCEANPTACYANPEIVQNNEYASVGSAVYQGGIIEVKKRFGAHYALTGNYTYSRAIDTTTDFNSDYGPQDPTNLGLERAVSDFDQRHALTVAGIIDSPWGGRFLSGFELAPIVQYHSGHPFNLLAGGATDGNNHVTNGRPIGAPRNTGLGPNYADFDMRLSWKYKISEKSTLQFTAEGFNLLNRTNYASVNDEVSPFFGLQPGFTTFNVHGLEPGRVVNGATVNSSTPLAFTAALPKREFQLGVRYSF